MQKPSRNEPIQVGTWVQVLKHSRVARSHVGLLARVAYSNDGYVTIVIFDEVPQLDAEERVVAGAKVQPYKKAFIFVLFLVTPDFHFFFAKIIPIKGNSNKKPKIIL